METTAFSKTDIQVSKLCFGAMGLGQWFGHYDESVHIKAVHNCLEQGVNIIDTARAYDTSEEILGKALKAWDGPRPFIATKAVPKDASIIRNWGMPTSIETSYPKGYVKESVEASLKALDVDYIDLVQLHKYWGQYLNQGTWLDELEELKSEGKIGAIGVSLADHRHDSGLEIVNSGRIDAVQTIVNIFDPLAFDSLVPACEENKVALIARCCLDEGGLSGFLKPGMTFDKGDFREKYFMAGPLDEYIRRVERLKVYISSEVESLAELALRYVTSDPGVTTANVSLHVEEYANMNIAAINKGPLPQDMFDEIRVCHRWLHNLYEEMHFQPSEVLKKYN
jgi:aryl-alcohol dehydrogenase-like predicted oxidoreductase